MEPVLGGGRRKQAGRLLSQRMVEAGERAPKIEATEARNDGQRKISFEECQVKLQQMKRTLVIGLFVPDNKHPFLCHDNAADFFTSSRQSKPDVLLRGRFLALHPFQQQVHHALLCRLIDDRSELQWITLQIKQHRMQVGDLPAMGRYLQHRHLLRELERLAQLRRLQLRHREERLHMRRHQRVVVQRLVIRGRGSPHIHIPSVGAIDMPAVYAEDSGLPLYAPQGDEN